MSEFTINLEQDKLRDPDTLIKIFETFGYCNFKIHKTYISFGRNEESNPTAIFCYFDRSRAWINDSPRSIQGDLIAFLMEEESLSFHETVKAIESIVGDKLYEIKPKRNAWFGGLYEVKNFSVNGENNELPSIDESVLEDYEIIGNRLFLKDGISLSTQKHFGIGFDEERQVITIPIYSHDGRLVGVKGRLNRKPLPKENKYFYLYPCEVSKTLFGYHQNISHLYNAKEIYIFEAEKAVMQAFSFGVRNCVSIGGATLSKEQCQLISYLNPKRVILMLDEGIIDRVLENDCKELLRHSFMNKFEVCYWVPSEGTPSKSSPTDLGYKGFLKAVGDIKVYENRP